MNIGYNRVSIEVDFKLVVDVNYISGKLSHRTEFGALLYTYRTVMHSLPNLRMSFITNQENNVPDLLARTTLPYASHQVFECIPLCIVIILTNETS